MPVSTIAIRPDTSTGKKEESEIDVVPAAQQPPVHPLRARRELLDQGRHGVSEARHALLRREALELALYTFKYVDGVDSVSVFLPPRPDGQAAPHRRSSSRRAT